MLEPEFEGVYGKYTITLADQMEVKKYRVAVFICGLSFSLGLAQWMIFGPNLAWIWLISMSIALGLALKWIHIYIDFLHKALQTLWVIGSLGIFLLLYNFGAQGILANIASKPILGLIISPFFASLTGLGFKEFFCFRRPEAIGLTLILPISLIAHLMGIFDLKVIMVLLSISAILLLTLSIRKFGLDAALDIGDKSIFEFLKNKKHSASTSGI